MLSVPTGQAPQGLNWATFTADEWDVFTADEWAGLIVGTEGLTAKFDAWNRLVQLSEPPASAGGVPVTVQEYDYDGRGYRIATKSYTAGTLSETRHYYYSNSWQVLEERLNTDTTPDRQFVWGLRYIDDLILRDRSVSGTLDERLYALQDGNWNVTTVVNTSGAVQERYEYDPYGQLTVLTPTFTARSASEFNWETTYCGYRWDAGTALYAVRHRYYSPLLGTWLSRDPIGYRGGVKFCSYNEPLTSTDPLGLDQHHWFPQDQGTVNLFDKKCGALLKVVNFTAKSFSDEYTTKMGPFQIGQDHHYIHEMFRQHPGDSKWKVKVKKMLNDPKKTCCEYLRSMQSMIYSASTALQTFYGNPGPGKCPEMVNYETGESPKKPMDDLIDQMCPQGPMPGPQHVPASSPAPIPAPTQQPAPSCPTPTPGLTNPGSASPLTDPGFPFLPGVAPNSGAPTSLGGRLLQGGRSIGGGLLNVGRIIIGAGGLLFVAPTLWLMDDFDRDPFNPRTS